MFLPLGAVLLLALLWTGYWLVASGQAQDRLEAERQELAARGLSLACGQESWGGYPFHFEFTCTAPVVTATTGGELRAARLLLVALAYAPWQVAALVDGPTNVRAPGLADTPVTHQRALAALTFDKAWAPSFSMELPVVSVPGLGTAARLALFTRPSASGGTEIAFDATQLSYRPTGRPAVEIDAASLRGTLEPTSSFTIEKFDANKGELRYWGSGRLALDSQHRLSGQIDTETNDVPALLAIAGPQLGLSDSKLSNLRGMLGLLGNGAKAPLIARDGMLYLGPFEIAELPPLY